MKKLFPLILSFLFIFTFTACSLSPTADKSNDDQPVVDNRDKIVPEITCSEPAKEAVDVAVDTNVKICFSEAMKLDAASYGKAFQFADSDGVMVEAIGAYNASDNTYVIDPVASLKAKTAYRLKVFTGKSQDLAGNALNAPLKLEFTTK